MNLNPEQEKAKKQIEGPLLILAGAGSGKTATLTARIEHKIKKFNKFDIINSLLENKPVVFWYLWKNGSGKLDTKPFVWYTQSGDKINGYIGQHTGLIVGVSLFDNGNINEVYFYEGRNSEVQIVKYADLVYQASFFDMMIVGE